MTPGDIIVLGLLAGLFFGVIAAFIHYVAVDDWDSKPWYSFFIVFGVTVVISLIGAGMRADTIKSPEYKAKIEREQKEEFEAQTPRKIGEKDGCSVYAFKSAERWHYFTKCQNTNRVDTTNTWTERRGKVTVEKSENITTEQN